jgi:hypothetical protein
MYFKILFINKNKEKYISKEIYADLNKKVSIEDFIGSLQKIEDQATFESTIDNMNYNNLFTENLSFKDFIQYFDTEALDTENIFVLNISTKDFEIKTNGMLAEQNNTILIKKKSFYYIQEGSEVDLEKSYKGKLYNDYNNNIKENIQKFDKKIRTAIIPKMQTI